jgi:hypothetical protein
MRKVISIGLILSTGLSSQAFAAAGYAKDGLAFSLFLIGFLLLVASVLKGIDYISKNGKTILYQVKAFIRTKMTALLRHSRLGKQRSLFTSLTEYQ